MYRLSYGRKAAGMQIMFHMMNEERQGVGMMGVSWPRGLPAPCPMPRNAQGNNLFTGQYVPIIQHPDVRRMLRNEVTEHPPSASSATGPWTAKVAERRREKQMGRSGGNAIIVKSYCTEWAGRQRLAVEPTADTVVPGISNR
jgi:hypothetical protein